MSARLGLAVGGLFLGGLVGFAFGAPFLGAQLGFLAGSIAGSILFPPDVPDSIGPRLDNLQVSSSALGRPVPIVYGRMRIGGNFVVGEPIEEVRHEEEVDLKGAPTQTVVSFSYFGSGAIVFCEGIGQILKLWADTELLYDKTNTNGPLLDSQFSGVFRFYEGNLTQKPDPVVVRIVGSDKAPAFRGHLYMSFDRMSLELFGNRIPNFTALVSTNNTDAYPVTIVTPGYGNPASARFSTDHRYLYLAGTGITKIDVASRTAVYTGKTFDVTHKGGDTQTIPLNGDKYGNFYLYVEDTDTPGNDTGHLEVFDVDGNFGGGTSFDSTNELIHLSLDDDDPFNIHAYAYNTPLLTGYIQKFWIKPKFSVTGDIEGWAPDTDGIIYKIDDYLPNTKFDPRGANFVKTNDGEIWTCLRRPILSAADDAYWVRVDRFTGEPVEWIQFDNLSGFECAFICYEPTTNTLFTVVNSGVEGMQWLDLNDNTQGLIQTGVEEFTSRYQASMIAGPNEEGLIYIQGGITSTKEIDLINREVSQVYTFGASPWGAADADGEYSLYDPINHAIIEYITTGGLSGSWQWIFLDRVAGMNVTDRDIVEDASSRVNYDIVNDIDATALTKSRHGYIFDRPMPAKTALGPLSQVGLWDPVESEFKIKFVNRGGASIATIPEDELGAYTIDQEPAPVFEEVHTDELEMPYEIVVNYVDPSMDYQSGSSSWKRIEEAVDTRHRITTQVPMAMSTTTARRICQQLINDSWIRRIPYDMPLSWKQLYLDPGDVIDWIYNGRTYRGVINETSYGDDGIYRLNLFSNAIPVITSDIDGQDNEGFIPGQILFTAASFYQVIDAPLLRDEDDGLIMYVVAGPQGNTETFEWDGVIIYRSSDGIVFDELWTAVPGNRDALFGFAKTALPDASPYKFDRDNTLTVIVSNGDSSSLQSISESEALQNGNPLIIQNGTDWEYLNYVNATYQGSGVWILDTFVRGRRGTETQTANHRVGDCVIFPTALTMSLKLSTISEIGINRAYKGITVGGTDGDVRFVKFDAESYRPYSPHGSKGTKSGNDWLVSYSRRTRVGGQWKNQAWSTLPVSQTSHKFEIDIINPFTGAVVNTYDSDAASANGSNFDLTNEVFTYTQADQIADLGAEQSYLAWDLYQVDDDLGLSKRSQPESNIAWEEATGSTSRHVQTIEATANGTSVTAYNPNAGDDTDIQDGDLLIAVLTQATSGSTFTPAAGFSSINEGTVAGGPIHTQIYQKIASSEGASWQFSSDASQLISLAIIVLRNVNSSTPILQEDVNSGSGVANHDFPILLIGKTPRTTLAIYSALQNSPTALTPPSGYTEISDFGNSTLRIHASIKHEGTGGLTDAVISNSASDEWVNFLLQIDIP